MPFAVCGDDRGKTSKQNLTQTQKAFFCLFAYKNHHI
jgi:hypothetical protein